MTDIVDDAGNLEMRQTAEAIARQSEQSLAQEKPFQIEGKRVCLDCFEPIALKRLIANADAVRCVDCQQDHDKRKKNGTA